MVDLHSLKDGLVVTAFWRQSREKRTQSLPIIRQYLPQAQREPWVHAFQIHRSIAEPHKFFFYEVFHDEAGFASHQKTPHFKALIAGQALPKLARRERTQHRFVMAGTLDP